MDEQLKNIETFFKLNLEIKNILITSAPNEEDNYNLRTRIKYGDKLYFVLKDLEDIFLKLCDCLNLSYYKTDFNKYFKNLQKKLLKAGYNFQKLYIFYQDNLANMNEELLNDIKDNICGFKNQINLGSLLNKAQSVNELAHILHSYVINNENIHNKLPTVMTLESNEKKITIYGDNWLIAKNIAEGTISVNSSLIDIVSLPKLNKIILMARDLGHALTIEMDVNEDKTLVRYFIPKICNPIKVNELKGVNKVPIKWETMPNGNLRCSDERKFTNGIFEVNTQNLSQELTDFLSKCPTDDDMFTYGGWFSYFDNSLTNKK